jgi:hypothetical protein
MFLIPKLHIFVSRSLDILEASSATTKSTTCPFFLFWRERMVEQLKGVQITILLVSNRYFLISSRVSNAFNFNEDFMNSTVSRQRDIFFLSAY